MKNTTNNLSEDTQTSSCQCGRSCTCHHQFWFRASIRIFIVVCLIVGAYGFGVQSSYHSERRGYMIPTYSEAHTPNMMSRSDDNEDMVRHCQMMPEMPGCEKYIGAENTHDMMSMSMADMGNMLKGKTGDALDKAFLEGMIPHHQGAVDMAQYLSGAKHPELQKMGQDIISAQTKEIEQMKAWQKEWGYTK